MIQEEEIYHNNTDDLVNLTSGNPTMAEPDAIDACRL